KDTMRSHLKELLTQAIEKTAKGGELDSTELPPLFLEPPKQREFGDLATNVAMLWAKNAKKPPRVIAEAILKNLEDPEGILARKEIAGPGFLNFAFSPKFYFRRLRELAEGKEVKVDLGHGEKVQVEFASVNPTGPLHAGHGRVAVIGDVLARLHEAAGFDVQREYYVNDTGKQMENLGRSLYARYRELFGEKIDFPQDGAEWFKSTQFGDDKDRTVIKSDGELTYFASDIAYHRNKFERRFGKLINVWGADHHGYVPRLKAAMQGLGYDPNVLQVVLVQMVQLTRGGEPVRMGK